MKKPCRTTRRAKVVAACSIAAAVLSGCSGSNAATNSEAKVSTANETGAKGAATRSQVLPVMVNPINNAASAPGLKIKSVLVENNEDPATKKAVDDHLEISLENVSTVEITGVEVYYSFTDSIDKITEGYYTKLPSDFAIPAGRKRVIHFDNSGTNDHFPVNQFSLYSTSKNALDVAITASAKGFAVQTTALKKDAGGAENAAE